MNIRWVKTKLQSVTAAVYAQLVRVCESSGCLFSFFNTLYVTRSCIYMLLRIVPCKELNMLLTTSLSYIWFALRCISADASVTMDIVYWASPSALTSSRAFILREWESVRKLHRSSASVWHCIGGLSACKFVSVESLYIYVAHTHSDIYKLVFNEAPKPIAGSATDRAIATGRRCELRGARWFALSHTAHIGKRPLVRNHKVAIFVHILPDNKFISFICPRQERFKFLNDVAPK